MATTADFKNGMCLDIDGQYYFIVEFLHVKPGKGPAFVRTKLKNVQTGRILDKTWNSGVKVNEVRIERRPYQYSYKDDMGYHFLHTETWEEVIIPGESIEGVQFLKDGDICEAMVHAESETILTCEIPALRGGIHWPEDTKRPLAFILLPASRVTPPPTPSSPLPLRPALRCVCPSSATSATRWSSTPATVPTRSA